MRVALSAVHRADKDAQQWACRAVVALATRSKENERRLSAAGARPAIVAAMDAHREHREVQRGGCAAIRHMQEGGGGGGPRARAGGAARALGRDLAACERNGTGRLRRSIGASAPLCIRGVGRDH